MELILGIQALLAATLRMATPLIFAAVGETFSERAGVLNIGLEGLMLIGACTAYTVAYYTQNLLLAILAAALLTALFGLIFAFVTIRILANQIIMGVVLNMVGLGLTGFVYRTLFAQTGLAKAVITLQPAPIPLLSQIPFIGEIFFNQNVLIYAIYVLIPASAWLLYRTNFGLAVRAVGEHPRAVASVGLTVAQLRYLTVVGAAALTGIGGAYLTIAHANQFVEGITAGRGFIALAMVPFGVWNPVWVGLAGLLFGGAFALQLRLQAGNQLIAYQFLQILPYVVTFVTLILAHRESAQPGALAVPYYEEE